MVSKIFLTKISRIREKSGFDRDWTTMRRRLSREWHELVLNYAPHCPSSPSIWRYRQRLCSRHPDQGWKIHVSGTPLNASRILLSILPVLTERQVVFKVPRSLEELIRINSGIFYGYSQIGKLITVYPENDEEFRCLIRKLHAATLEFEGPQVPFDFCYANRSCVYFRYGAFKMSSRKNPDIPILTAPDGTKIPDNRRLADYVPSWSPNPVNKRPSRPSNTAFSKRYCIFRSIVQRGKGGIYEAIDIRRASKVIIKEGRANGEVGWDGRDGRDRLRNEMVSLAELHRARVPVPKILASFQSEGNTYAVLEKINGVTLQALIDQRFFHITDQESLTLALKVAEVVSAIHQAGWVWRDCKPANLLITPSEEVRPVDFEGACRVDRPSTLPWASKGFASPETLTAEKRSSNLPEDLYALGATLHFLFTGFLPKEKNGGTRPGHLPERLRETIKGLLEANPKRRPNAAAVISHLSSCLDELPAV
jgi:hypothetical protein